MVEEIQRLQESFAHMTVSWYGRSVAVKFLGDFTGFWVPAVALGSSLDEDGDSEHSTAPSGHKGYVDSLLVL